MDLDSLLKKEQRFYDLRWQRAGLSQRDVERVQYTCNSVPSDCQTILDVGAGDGTIAMELLNRGKSVSAVDLSPVALSRIPVPGYCESANSLSFSDKSFDLVLSTEMLEHLPQPVYEGAIREFARVASKYILITVPNREVMREHLALCAGCGCKFHIWGHARSYTIRELKNLFSGFSVRILSQFGHTEPDYHPLLLWIKQSIGGIWAWDEDSPCPECHERLRTPSRFPMLGRVCDSLNYRVWGRLYHRKAWMLALYERSA